MWNGKNKAITFSFDDGNTQDERLVELLNKYNLKCTFNLNSGIQSYAYYFMFNSKEIHRMNVSGLKKLYKGHEIAVHTLTHPHLENLDKATIFNEINQDIINLAAIFGYSPVGMAYPFGTYNLDVIEVIKRTGIKYARTFKSNYDFNLQNSLLEFNPTVHFADMKAGELIKKFLDLKTETPQILYIWGHSYEMEEEFSSFTLFEDYLKELSFREDIFYGTNREVLLK